MRDLHRKQAKEYEETRHLSLHNYIALLEKRAQEVLKKWGLREKPLAKGRKQIIPMGK